jgi:hypothetical protein
MIRQGFSIGVLPTGNTNTRYNLWINSNAYDGDRCFSSRQLYLGEIDALPAEVSARSLSEWIDTMLTVVTANVRKQLLVQDMASISAAKQDEDRASETLSQNM